MNNILNALWTVLFDTINTLRNLQKTRFSGMPLNISPDMYMYVNVCIHVGLCTYMYM